MAEIARFLGIIISLYLETGAQHHHPHFHVRYNEYKAVYGITPVVQLTGALPLRQQRIVEAWAEIHQQELQAAWDAVQRGGAPGKIPGLG
jgi:hypothetical protein